MKKSIKIFAFIFLTIVSTILLTDNVKAVCKDYDKEQCETIYKTYGNCKYDEETEECIKADVNEVNCASITEFSECSATDGCFPLVAGNEFNCVSKSEMQNNEIQKYIKFDKNPFKCSDVKYLTGAWTLIRIAAPFIVILFGSLDFIKAVMASDEKKMKETKGKFIKRVIAFVLLILLPFVVQFIFSNMGTNGSENMCLVKCIVTNNTSDEECD